MKSYFNFLRDTQNLRKFRDDAHAALLANPEDMNATARTFYTTSSRERSMSRSRPSAISACTRKLLNQRGHHRSSTSARACWKIFIRIRNRRGITSHFTTARGLADAQEKAITGLTSLLLTAPETPIRFGSGELSMYRDIATMDQGPGYLNGILSLILNTTQPAARYSEEEQRAVPYFHRSRAAELLALLDRESPKSTERPRCTRSCSITTSRPGRATPSSRVDATFSQLTRSLRTNDGRTADGRRLRAQGRYQE